VRPVKKFRVKETRGNEIILREKPIGMERSFYLLTELVNLEALKNRRRGWYPCSSDFAHCNQGR
jgi:hypothetical protein